MCGGGGVHTPSGVLLFVPVDVKIQVTDCGLKIHNKKHGLAGNGSNGGNGSRVCSVSGPTLPYPVLSSHATAQGLHRLLPPLDPSRIPHCHLPYHSSPSHPCCRCCCCRFSPCPPPQARWRRHATCRVSACLAHNTEQHSSSQAWCRAMPRWCNATQH